MEKLCALFLGFLSSRSNKGRMNRKLLSPIPATQGLLKDWKYLS